MDAITLTPPPKDVAASDWLVQVYSAIQKLIVAVQQAKSGTGPGGSSGPNQPFGQTPPAQTQALGIGAGVIVPISEGGTGATSSAAARSNLGAATKGSPGTHTIILAKITGGGANGSITWNADGTITAFVDPT